MASLASIESKIDKLTVAVAALEALVKDGDAAIIRNDIAAVDEIMAKLGQISGDDTEGPQPRPDAPVAENIREVKTT